ncbi:MAG: hypothetical protein IT337_03330 [Thermomicrobiales bacterium]|nr:hypothetical protein [Thermomicrobiales bacterium]
MDDRFPCPACSTLVGADDQFCSTCGARLDSDEAVAAESPPTPAPAGRFASSREENGVVASAPEPSAAIATAPVTIASIQPALAVVRVPDASAAQSATPTAGASRPIRQIVLGVALLALSVVLVVVGKADPTDTLGIIGLLIAPFAALYVVIGALRAVGSWAGWLSLD